VVQKHKLKDVYGFALYSDEGAMTVCPAVNTLSYLKRALKDDPNDEGTYYFYPSKWQYEGDGATDAIEKICTRVRTAVIDSEERKDDEKWFVWFKKNLFETCIKALENLHRKQFFARFGDKDFLVMFTISDGDVNAETEVARVARLNSPAVVAAFKKYTSSWGK
jgi:Domain of unknown function (DUF4303)